MLSKNTYYPVILALAVFFLFPGCSSTKLVTSWSDPNFSDGPIRTILLAAVMKDTAHRQLHEELFAERLGEEDVIGIAAHTVIHPSDPKGLYDEDEIRTAIKSTGADAAIIVRLVGIEKKERYVPPTYEYEPVFGFHRGLYGYHGMSDRYELSPGYTKTDTIVKLETTVFSSNSEKLIWAGDTQSSNPSSPLEVISKNADIITEDMKEYGLLQ